MNTLIEIKNLSKHFPIRDGRIFSRDKVNKAVDDVTFSINENEAFGLVGESGCGKTTLGKLILGLFKPNAGEIIYNGKIINSLSLKELKSLSKDFNVIFQDPYSSLNPKMTIIEIIKEPLKITGFGDLSKNYILQTLKKVGLSEEHLFRYPHEFSGGQRQRIAIARAIAANPKFLILDEPTSGLDVSVQAQILNILHDIRKQYNIIYLFISHNIGVIKYMCDRIAIMYRGKIVELAEKEELFKNPLHFYTIKLLAAVPDINFEKTSSMEYTSVEIEKISKEQGCVYSFNCKEKNEKCENISPELKLVKDSHYVACHMFE